MKNVIKLTAAAMMMSTAAFADIETNWTASDVDLGTVLSGATPGSAFDTAASNLEGFLKGYEFIIYGAPTLIDGDIVTPTTTEFAYSNLSIQAQIENIRNALTTDVYGDSNGIELDGSDTGILGAVANEVLVELGEVQAATTALKENYIANAVGTSEIADLADAVDDLIEDRTAFNDGAAAFTLILDDLVAKPDYNNQ